MRAVDLIAIIMALAGCATLIIAAVAISTGRGPGLAPGSLPLAMGLLFGGVILYCQAGDETS